MLYASSLKKWRSAVPDLAMTCGTRRMEKLPRYMRPLRKAWQRERERLAKSFKCGKLLCGVTWRPRVAANQRYRHRIYTNDPSRILWQIRADECVYWRHATDSNCDGDPSGDDVHQLTSCIWRSPNSCPSHRVWCPWDGTSYIYVDTEEIERERERVRDGREWENVLK